MREMYFMCAVYARGGGAARGRRRGARRLARARGRGVTLAGGNPEGGFARRPVQSSRARLGRGRGGACVCVNVCAYECMTDV